MSERAVAPVVGVALLVAVTVVLASAVGAGVVLQFPGAPPDPTAASFDAEADATGEIRVVHTGGDAIDPDALRLAVRVDGVPLTSQPPIPFFSARGFESGPTGVFNSATHGEWRAGQAASLGGADSNEPALSEGATVELRIYADDVRVAVLDVTVQVASTVSPPSSVPDVSVAGSLPSVPSLVASRWVSGSLPASASVSGT